MSKEETIKLNRLKYNLIVEFKQILSNNRESLSDIIKAMKEKFNSILPNDNKLISLISSQLGNLESILTEQIINYSSNHSEFDLNKGLSLPGSNLPIHDNQYKSKSKMKKNDLIINSEDSENTDPISKMESSDFSQQITPLKEEYEKMKIKLQEIESKYSMTTKNKNEEIIKLSDKFSCMQKQYQGIIDKLKGKETFIKKEI